MKTHSKISPEVRKKIKDITIKTQRLLRGSMVGDSRSAIKGTGFEFDQIREYQFGDDIRFIDWKASSRSDKILVKQYFEERSRTILLAVDISASAVLGSGSTLKRDIFAQVASVLTLVTTSGKDRVGLILFSNEVELYIPPSRGLKHAHTIMQALFSHQAKSRTTSINNALKQIAHYKQKDALVFIISDFIDAQLDEKMLSHVSSKHETYAVRCLDTLEKTLSSFGFLPIMDSETGQTTLIDTRNKHSLNQYLQERIAQQARFFKQKGIRLIEIANNHTFIADLVRFFRRRMQY